MRQHIIACQAPGITNPDRWVLIQGSLGEWGPPSNAIYRGGIVEDAVNALIQSNYSQNLTVTEEPFGDDLAAFPDSTSERTNLSILCPAIAGTLEGLWGFVALERDGSYRASPVVLSSGDLPAMLRDMAAQTWAKPLPAIIRCFQVRPDFGLDQFGYRIVGGKVVPLPNPPALVEANRKLADAH